MSKRVLYIEDDKAQIALMERYLERENYDMAMDFFHTGQEGIEAFDPDKYALVLIDYNLPDGEAPDIAQAILNKSNLFPIAFMSNAFTHDRRQKAKDLNIKACIKKDNPKENLDEIIALLCD